MSTMHPEYDKPNSAAAAAENQHVDEKHAFEFADENKGVDVTEGE